MKKIKTVLNEKTCLNCIHDNKVFVVDEIAMVGCEYTQEKIAWCQAEGHCLFESKYPKENDAISHPSHYTSVVPGIECIEVTQHFNFNRGNAIKYVWRAGSKNLEKEIEDLRKAITYIEFEIKRIEERGTK